MMFTYRGYVGKCDLQADEQLWVGRIALARDVVTFKGETPEDAEREFHESVEDYLEFCQQLGVPPEQPRLVETGAEREGDA